MPSRSMLLKSRDILWKFMQSIHMLFWYCENRCLLIHKFERRALLWLSKELLSCLLQIEAVRRKPFINKALQIHGFYVFTFAFMFYDSMDSKLQNLPHMLLVVGHRCGDSLCDSRMVHWDPHSQCGGPSNILLGLIRTLRRIQIHEENISSNFLWLF